MGKLKTTEEVIKDFKKVHGDRYDYSLVEYVGSKIKVKIICPKHCVFEQIPNSHLNGKGCNKCGYDTTVNKIIQKTKPRKNYGIIQPDDYKIIPLTKGKFAKVDNEDFDRLNNYTWSLNCDGYAVNSQVGLMHRFIINTPNDMKTDHINHDRLYNRKHNLRTCTNQQNQMNRSINVLNNSGYKGVYKYEKYNKWMSRIKINGKTKYIGLYNSPLEAAKSYDEKAKELFGEFANTNF